MSLAQRVLLTWLFTLLFLILLVLKLDGRVQWSWFLVFTPVWVFDGSLALVLAVRMAGRCKAEMMRAGGGASELRPMAWHFLALLLKLAFCVALCARLHGILGRHILAVYICIPLWVLLTGALIQLGYAIFPQRTV